jgi:hypothetical protein
MNGYEVKCAYSSPKQRSTRNDCSDKQHPIAASAYAPISTNTVRRELKGFHEPSAVSSVCVVHRVRYTVSRVIPGASGEKYSWQPRRRTSTMSKRWHSVSTHTSIVHVTASLVSCPHACDVVSTCMFGSKGSRIKPRSRIRSYFSSSRALVRPATLGCLNSSLPVVTAPRCVL